MSHDILIGCECSGVVRDAFRKLGFIAYSCDLKPAEGDDTYHLQMDIYDAINSSKWAMIGLHPDCTALAVSGNRWYGVNMPMHEKRLESLKWTVELWKHATSVCDHVYLENPVGVLTHELGKPTYIQPWQFGHGETKKTGLWLKNLPKLEPTNIVEGREARIHKMPPSPDRAKLRSITYKGIANAMAEQWG